MRNDRLERAAGTVYQVHDLLRRRWRWPPYTVPPLARA
jgi:hypothetical protein